MADTETSAKIKVTADTREAVKGLDGVKKSTDGVTTAAREAGAEAKAMAGEMKAGRAVIAEATTAITKQAEATKDAALAEKAFGKDSAEAAAATKVATAAQQAAAKAAAASAAEVKRLEAEMAKVKTETNATTPAMKRLEAQLDQARAAADKQAKALNRMSLEQKAAERAAKGTGSSFDIMGMAGGKLMSVLGPAALGGTLIGLAGWLGDAAAATLQYETAVANLPFALDGAQAATHGLMSETKLAMSASSALALGVVKTEAEFNALASDAAKIALKLGVSTDQMLGDLTTALGRGSAMILDNAGIILKVGDANEAYAKSIGKTVEQLDEAEKKIAFQTAAMEAIRKSADSTVVAYDGNAAALARLKITAGDTWDSVERGTVNAAGAVASSLDGPIDAFRDYMKANEEAQEATDALTREMMRSEGWSQGFKDLSASAGDTAASLLGMSDVVANFQRVLNDPAAYEQAANGLTIEREKAELMQREAHFAELQQKALEKIYKDQEAHLEAQAAASVVYGPALPPKEEKKKKGPKKKTALDLVKSTEFVHDESMGFGRNDALEALDTERQAQQKLDDEALAAAEANSDRRLLMLDRETEALEARGAAETVHIDAVFMQISVESEAQAQREDLLNRRLAAEEAAARELARLATTDAQREQATTRMEQVEHNKRLAAIRRQQAAEAKEWERKTAIVAKVTGTVQQLGGAMVEAAWQAADGQKGAGLQALSDYLKTVSKQMAIKALVETALGVSALAGIVSAGLAPGHFAAAGLAAAAAAAAGAAGAATGAAASAVRGEGGGAGAGAGGFGPRSSGSNRPQSAERERQELADLNVIPISREVETKREGQTGARPASAAKGDTIIVQPTIIGGTRDDVGRMLDKMITDARYKRGKEAA